MSEVGRKYRDCRRLADKPMLAMAVRALGSRKTTHMHWVMFFLIQQEDRADERQQGLRYKLKSLWIHQINMITRAMCQSFSTYQEGCWPPEVS